jgi:hypothetical protein
MDHDEVQRDAPRTIVATGPDTGDADAGEASGGSGRACC